MPRRKLWNVSDRLRHQPYRRLLNFLKNISPIGTYLSRIPVNVINAIAAMGSAARVVVPDLMHIVEESSVLIVKFNRAGIRTAPHPTIGRYFGCQI